MDVRPDPIYLDNHASTELDPIALDAMLPFLRRVGNASSTHHFYGRCAAAAVDAARAEVGALLGARPQHLIFTSGATEANNLAIRGVVDAANETRPRARHLISTPIEHPAVLEPLRMLKAHGYTVSYLGVDGTGRIDVNELREKVRPDTLLVSIATANNEIGTLQPMMEIVAAAHEQGVLVHTDAAQAIGKVPVDVEELGVDLLSLSGHKFHGPQGIGALYVRPGVRIRPQHVGGGQEQGRRSGTTNTAACVGLGVAAGRAGAALAEDATRIAELREQFTSLLRRGDPRMIVNGPPPAHRLPGNLHITFPGAEADAVIANCPNVAMAAGSACSSGAPGMSHVLRAIGLTDDAGEASLRLGLSRYTTEADILTAASYILDAVQAVRARSALQEPGLVAR